MIEKITDEEEKSEAVIDIVRTINKFEKNDKDDAERTKVTFIIEALEGATAEPIRRKVPFYLPDND